MRVSSSKLSQVLYSQLLDQFAQLLADLKTKDDVKVVLTDILTDTERELLVKRLAIIYYLHKGRSYTNIKQNLKVSSATIASAAALMARPGIKHALKLMTAEEWANKWADKFTKLTNKK